MADTKQTKTIGEHYAAAELARRHWAPALTRDGIERSDILAVHTSGDERRLIELQVKTTRYDSKRNPSWLLGSKAQEPSMSGREYFVLVAVPTESHHPPRYFVVPRNHLAAGAWIAHMSWLKAPGVPAGQRNVLADRARAGVDVFGAYEDAWDLLHIDDGDAESRLPERYREFAIDPEIGLPAKHPWALD